MRERMRRCLRRFAVCVWRGAVCSRRSKPWSSSSRAPCLLWRRYLNMRLFWMFHKTYSYTSDLGVESVAAFACRMSMVDVSTKAASRGGRGRKRQAAWGAQGSAQYSSQWLWRHGWNVGLPRYAQYYSETVSLLYHTRIPVSVIST